MQNPNKRKEMFLDLNSARATGGVGGKRVRRYQPDVDGSSGVEVKQEILSSPDLLKLKLATPDMEKFIQSGALGATPTPTGGQSQQFSHGGSGAAHQQIFFPKNVTQEQELYAKGFEDALARLQNDPPAGALSAGDDSSTRLSTESSNDMFTHGGSVSGTEPIDMDNQEKIKLERKRQRNRIAASKCRKRKLERIAKLEDKVTQLKGENANLTGVLEKLKSSVGDLRSKIMSHVNMGCQIRITE